VRPSRNLFDEEATLRYTPLPRTPGEQRHRAGRYVAASARDAADAALLLAVLGLDATEALSPRMECTA
jgi:hypothetical protein